MDTDNVSGSKKTVSLHIDSRVWREIKRQAIYEDAPIGVIATEALMVYVKWLRKTDAPERRVEIREIMKEIRKEQLVNVGVRRGRYKRKAEKNDNATG